MNKLRKIRRLKDITQYDLVAEVGMSQSKISLIEHGHINPKVDEKEKLAKALNTSVKELFPIGKTLLTMAN